MKGYSHVGHHGTYKKQNSVYMEVGAWFEDEALPSCSRHSSLINGIHFIDITYKKIVIANGREHVKNEGLFFSHERLRFS